ncbi:carbamoyltransferase C-terminal domain-containing protein [Streptomyces sp. NRRL B-24484]|uniref:carbamoyltransferase C-terminal domain-containing protein n=1 Tax=Streptomyces sp. NRRL B-24484 TaxID=1463833 RepID=UPI0006935CF7|nr:carbamoyltransferase C-terminal domain-containing protein [Streptomyces sp. NRRL B-24484]
MAEHFLSAYLTPPGPGAVFSVRHDQNVALWRRDGDRVDLVRVWELERVSGQKHHFWPLYTEGRATAFLAALLAEEGLVPADVTACWGTPGLPGDRPVPKPAGAEDFPVHSLAHLFSGILRDTRLFREEQIVGLAIDALPDYAQENRPNRYWYAGCVVKAGAITFLPVESPGPLYTAAETVFGLEPGSLMALASASETSIAFDAEAGVRDVTFFGGSATQPWKAAHDLVREIVAEAERQLGGAAPDPALSAEDNLRSAVMKVVQRCCEAVAIRNVERLLEAGGIRAEDTHLATTGGYALNCPTNTLLMDRFGFRSLITPPCANDSGQGIGLGLLGLYGAGLLETADLRIDTAYFGREVLDTEEALAEFAPWIDSVTDFDPEQFVADVSDGVVAWVDGRAELGPRALGHRSLLGDPRSTKVKDLLNEYKRRQWWRPVAPMVMAEHAADWFACDRESPYMLEAVQVRPEVRPLVPAVVHLDGSARHQTVTAASNPLLHRALDAFRAATGVPVLCNTSLNDKGEAVVDQAAEALNLCVRKGIAVLYLCGRRVALRSGPVPAAEAPTEPRPRALHHFAGQEDDRDALWQGWLDAGYTVEGMYHLSRSHELRAERELSTPDRVNMLAAYRAAVDPSFSGLAENFRRTHGPGGSFVDPSTLTGAFGVINPLRRGR